MGDVLSRALRHDQQTTVTYHIVFNRIHRQLSEPIRILSAQKNCKKTVIHEHRVNSAPVESKSFELFRLTINFSRDVT